MRDRTRVTLALSVAAALAACQPQREPQPQARAAVDTAAVKATIDSLRSAWEKGVAASDYKSMVTLLADGAVMVQPGSAAWDSLATAAAGAPFPPGATIDITPIEIHVLSPEWAYEFGTSVVTYTPKGTAQARKLNDTYLILFRNSGDGWKVYREVASANSPPNPVLPGP